MLARTDILPGAKVQVWTAVKLTWMRIWQFPAFYDTLKDPSAKLKALSIPYFEACSNMNYSPPPHTPPHPVLIGSHQWCDRC